METELEAMLKTFRIVSDRIQSKSLSHVRISTTSIIFSATAASEIGYPEHVKLLIHPSGKMLAIQATTDTDPTTTIPFCTNEVMLKLRKKPGVGICLKNKALASVIREKMHWDDKCMMKAFGNRHLMEEVVIYDLENAFRAKEKKSGLATADDILKSYPQNGVQEFRPIQALLPAYSSSDSNLDEEPLDIVDGKCELIC